ncbi:MAG: Ca-activated chloride channel family protein [Kiritimatiellia bacterium]|jgi:Ca-activated chloride channel homolog
MYPWLLGLFLLVPLMTWLRYRRASYASVGFSEGEMLARMPATWTVALHRLLPVLYVLGLCALIIAISRPRTGLEESRSEMDVIDIVLVVDVSGSMQAMDFASATNLDNRLDAAKDVIREFIKTRTGDRLGLIGFAALPYTLAPLTLDHAWLVDQVDRLEIGMVDDGTGIGVALASAVNQLKEQETLSKIVILLTDGINNTGSISPVNAAQAAQAKGVKVYTVGAGADGRVKFPVKDILGRTRYQWEESKIDEATLKEMAELTDGKYFRARDRDSLKAVYAEIDEMERTEIEIEQYTRYEEKFFPFAAAGLILLLLERMLGLGRLGRLP